MPLKGVRANLEFNCRHTPADLAGRVPKVAAERSALGELITDGNQFCSNLTEWRARLHTARHSRDRPHSLSRISTYGFYI